MNDLLKRCVDAYWSSEHGPYGLHSEVRMAKAFEVIAAEIRQWAPDPAVAKICHLAVNEVADMLLKYGQERTNPESKSASS